ncbi:hypothetical protein [Anaeromicrobium sediminis]|uniref:Uncharacterized protein n=1 Tax=Anaeromicrobium sediminis TaxID=1478221 RepID=A0A267MGN7_9FIRM|nr:hypothetical protein [Anaeromicrobium sediminis]PAB58716.1 hypothetical protein CCE28_13680 [Anaeromicrobium sediminis]
MDMESIIGIVLSGIISLIIYDHIGRNFTKLIKIICFVFMPIGILIWIHEIFITHSISFSQFGAIYIAGCLFFVILSSIGKITDEYLNMNSPRSDPIIFLYVGIFILIDSIYLYIFEK